MCSYLVCFVYVRLKFMQEGVKVVIPKCTCAAMMDWPAAWNDIMEVRLHVLQRNAAAVALYKKWGFEVVDTKLDYFVGHPVLRMVKKITRK